MRFSSILTICTAFSLASYAKNSSEISASYVSPLQYQSLTCPQLQEEASRVSSRAMAAMGEQNDKASRDVAITAVGAVVFWPALLMTNGKGGASELEVARLKGEMDAIEQASTRKNCGIQFQRAAS
jgi:hypothetical protein